MFCTLCFCLILLSAEEKNKDLSSELAEAQDLARRYRDKYNEEKEKSGNRPGSPNRSNSASIGPKSCKSAKTQRNGKDKDHTDSNNQVTTIQLNILLTSVKVLPYGSSRLAIYSGIHIHCHSVFSLVLM